MDTYNYCSQSHYIEVAQYTIDCEYLAYFKAKRNKSKINHKTNIKQLFSADDRVFKIKFKKSFPTKTLKNCPQKLLILNRPQFFFSLLPTGPKSTQISYSVP